MSPFSVPPQLPLPESHISFTVTHRGRLDAIAVWFDLHLLEDVFFSTSPSWNLSWEQAVFPQSLLTPTHSPQHLTVEEGDTLQLHASCSELSLYMHAELAERAVPVDSGECGDGGRDDGRHGNDGCGSGGFSIDINDSEYDEHKGDDRHGDSCHGYVGSSRRLFYVERADLLRLNDTVFMNRLETALQDVMRSIHDGEESEYTVLCLHQGLSVCGLTAAKLGESLLQHPLSISSHTRCVPGYRVCVCVCACVALSSQNTVSLTDYHACLTFPDLPPP